MNRLESTVSHGSWRLHTETVGAYQSEKKSLEFEAERHETAMESRSWQTERTAFQLFSAKTFVCPKCSRVCASRIGLTSH